MKKVFVVAGELSGDQVGAWYLKKRYQEDKNIYVQAIGGDYIKKTGAHLHDRFEKLNVVGIVEILGSLPRILSYMKKLVAHIKEGSFDELVLVDFPGFNLRLARIIKKACPHLKIIYVSPPQLWVWGAWRVKKLARYVDTVIVIYEFEVAWYAKHGIKAQWLGYPFFDELSDCVSQAITKKNRVALIAGSRSVELKILLPVFAQVVHKLKLLYPDVEIVVPRAESISREKLELALIKYGVSATIIEGRRQKLEALSSCVVALSKPGTVTLELAFLGVPSIVAYKTSFLTYYIGRMVAHVAYMSLPNLLLNKPIYSEYIQSECQVGRLSYALIELYKNSQAGSSSYINQCQSLESIRSILAKNGPF